MKKRQTIAAVRDIILVLMILTILPATESCQCSDERTIIVDSVVEGRYQFGDLNDTQLDAALRYGIDPLPNREAIDAVSDQLVEISTNGLYKLDRLDYSVPYLTPSSASLLSDIGQRFQDRLHEGGYRRHRIVVTSVLRTQEDVDRLMGKNKNATKNSCHQYATTFDITYVRFERMSLEGSPIADKKLCNVLGAVLEELRNEGRCYVKFEHNQHCFHITSRM